MEGRMENFTDLLPECQVEAMKWLGIEDLFSLSAVNKKWNELAFKLIKYAELRHLTSPKVISKLTNLEELILNFFEWDAPWWFSSLRPEMLSSTNLRRLRTEYFNWHTDDSDVTHPDDAPYFDILKQMTQLEQIEFFSSKVPYLDMIFPGFSRLTSLFLNTPFDAGCAAHWQISSQLRHLELYQANTVPVTAPLQHATNLTYLDISFHGAKNRIRHLTNLKTLVVSFDFAGTPIECKDLAFLNQLKSLKFHSWDEIDIDLLTVLPTLGQLDDLSLRLPIDEAQDRGMVVRKLKEISRMVNLTSLELSSTIQNEAEIEFSRLTNLKRLNPGISKDVTSLINLPNLEYLYFNHVPPSLELLGTLTALTTLTELEILYETTLQDNPLVDFVVETFPRCKRLTAVKIGRGGRVNTDLRSEWKRQKDLAAQK